MRIKSIIAVTPLIFTLLACSPWKLLKKNGDVIGKETGEFTYILKEELYGEAGDGDLKKAQEKLRNEYYEMVKRDSTVKPIKDSDIEKFTETAVYRELYKRRKKELPRNKTILYMKFSLDWEKLKDQVMIDYYSNHGLVIECADRERIKDLMTEANKIYNILIEDKEVTFYSGEKFYGAPARRITDIAAFMVPLGNGEQRKSGNVITIDKEPDANTKSKIASLSGLVDARKMVTLKETLSALPTMGGDLAAVAEQRIAQSKEISDNLDTGNVDVNGTINRLYKAADLCSEGKSREKFDEFYHALEENKITVMIDHPDGTGYLNSGYSEPFTISARNSDDESVRGAFSVYTVDGDVTIGATKEDYKELPVKIFPGEAGGVSFYINSISSENCKIKAVLTFEYLDEKDALFKKVYGRGLSSVMPVAIQELKNISTFTSEGYAEYASLSNEPAVVIENNAASIKVAGNGQFTIGGFINRRPGDYLYGHPNGIGPDGIWSSFVTVRVDGIDYRFDKLPVRGPELVGRNVIETSAEIQEKKIVIKQTLKFSEEENFTRISYSVVNRDDAPHAVGIRILMDTWAGANDGVPFRIPRGENSRSQTGELVRYETELFGLDTEYFEACEIGRDEKILIKGDFRGGESRIPDRLVLASWSSAYDSEWEYEPDPFRPVTFDSAVLIYYNPVEVAPGQGTNSSFRYGLYTYTGSVDVPETVTTENSTFVCSASYYNSSDELKDVTIEIIPQDNRIRVLEGTPSSYSLKVDGRDEGVVFFRLQATGAARGESTVKIAITDESGKKEHLKTIAVEGDSLIISERKIDEKSERYPVRFTLFGDKPSNAHIVAALVDEGGAVIQKKIMYDDGLHNDGSENDGVYGTDFNMSEISSNNLLIRIYRVSRSGQ